MTCEVVTREALTREVLPREVFTREVVTREVCTREIVVCHKDAVEDAWQNPDKRTQFQQEAIV